MLTICQVENSFSQGLPIEGMEGSVSLLTGFTWSGSFL